MKKKTYKEVFDKISETNNLLLSTIYKLKRKNCENKIYNPGLNIFKLSD